MTRRQATIALETVRYAVGRLAYYFVADKAALGKLARMAGIVDDLLRGIE